MGLFNIIDEIVYGKENWLEKEDRLMKQDKFFFNHNGEVEKRITENEEVIELVGKLEFNNKKFDEILLEGKKWMN